MVIEHAPLTLAGTSKVRYAMKYSAMQVIGKIGIDGQLPKSVYQFWRVVLSAMSRHVVYSRSPGIPSVRAGVG